MGLCLGAGCERLVLSKRPWKQVRARPEGYKSTQLYVWVPSPSRLHPSAFGALSIHLGTRIIQVSLEIPRRM